MTSITCEQLPALFQGVAAIFAEKKEELCNMDAQMGDGDLGLTMDKGYGALPALLQENMEAGDIGKTLMKGGMKMSSLVPSTMGTLMSSGIMEGGKALKGKDAMGPRELADCLTAFAAGVQKRGKCQPGDRTILDALDAGAQAAAKAAEEGGDLSAVIAAACEGAAGPGGGGHQGYGPQIRQGRRLRRQGQGGPRPGGHGRPVYAPGASAGHRGAVIPFFRDWRTAVLQSLRVSPALLNGRECYDKGRIIVFMERRRLGSCNLRGLLYGPPGRTGTSYQLRRLY